MEFITDVKEITSLCIICLNKDKRMIDLSDFLFDDQKYILIKVILEKIMSVKVLSYYPKVICVDCLGSLKTALKLKQKFEKSIEDLRKWLESHNHQVSVENDIVDKERLIISEKIQGKPILIVREDSKENSVNTNFLNNSTVNFGKEETNPEKPISDCAIVKTNGKVESTANSALCPSSLNLPKKKQRFFCEHCQKCYFSQEKYNHHVKVCCTTCKNCCKRLPNVGKLKEHLLNCENNGTYECDICTQRFDTMKKKYSHTRTHKKTVYKCKLCDIIFSSSGGLQYHKNKMHDNLSYSCNICGKTFNIKSNYTQHLNTHNKGLCKVICPICGKKFHYGTGLFYHMKVHQNIRNYKCKYCSKKFLTMSGLKRHERTHTGERPYICSYCAKTFSSLTELKKHEMRHTGEKPHVCIYCNSRFISQYNLKLHMSSHAGSYPCDICGKSYLNAHVLKLHTKFKHVEDVEKLDIKEEVQ